MLRSDAPVDLTQFASDLAKFNINSRDTILDLSSIPDNAMVLEVRISPYPEGELAIVAVHSMQVEGQGEFVVESSIRELIPIHRINTIGKGLLVAASGKSVFEFNSSADSALTARGYGVMDVAYVTKYTHSRLAGSFLQKDDGLSLDNLYSILFDEGLAQLLNDKEAMRLYIQKLMIESKFEELEFSPRKFSRKYVFAVGNPKFHKSLECEFLSSDFTNYKVPPEIEVLGPDKVREFQKFCENNKHELQEKKEEYFWAHVGAAFRVKINPAKVNYANSGIRDVRGMTISQIESLVTETIKEAVGMVSHPLYGQAVQRVRYAPHREKALAAIGDDGARKFVGSFFNLKQNVTNYLFEMYKKQSGADGYVLPVNLLLAADIEPCKACFGGGRRG